MLVRPTKQDLADAYGKTIPDVVAPGLAVLFCGINPGLYSAATARHFARPGNRFWPALHRGGFTPYQVDPADQERLLGFRLGITNVVARATARADELTADEFRSGALTLTAKVRRLRPAWVAILGVGAYRTGFGRPGATIGIQPDRLAGAGLWILPNPSGLNAHYTLDRLAEEFGRLRVTADDARAGTT